MLNTDAHLTNLVANLKPGDPVSLPPEPRSEKEIMANWRVPRLPLVSICCATFNHASYIKDALHGFLSQETSFPFEIIVRDDASTDSTSEVVREYARQYPNIVRAVIEKGNQFKKGVRPLHAWPALAKGEFVALCEGDDFWIDSFKLQKQVDLLQQHPEAVMSVAKTNLCKQEGDRLFHIRIHEGNDRALQDFEDVKRHYFHTSTYVIRRKVFSEVISKYFSGHCLFGDTALRSILVSHGPFAYLPDVVSVYRQTGSGIWTSLSRDKQLQWEIDAAVKLASMLTGKHRKHQQERLFRLYISKLIASLKAGRVTAGLALLPRLLHYGVIKVPSYARKKFSRVGQYFQ
jgi:glycosyltransferase involved in cell wall biosynthesis